MTRRLFLSLTVVLALAVWASGAVAKTRWPSRLTPLSSTLGWFKAINSHNRTQLLFYVAPHAQDRMGWAEQSVAWPKFTDLHCKTLRTAGRSRAELLCMFHESASPSEGNPDSFWDVDLRHTSVGWLIYSYGQG